MSFMQSIKELREKNSLSQMEFAKSIDVKTGTIAEWESGESEPTLEQLSRISSVFHVSLDDLINSSQSSVTKLYESENPKEVFHKSSVEESESKDNTSDELQLNRKRKKQKHLSTLIISIILIISLVVGLCVFLFPRKTAFSDNTEAISNAENSVVKVYCYDYSGKESSTGSGFFAFDSQTVVTNYHVACEGYTIKISTSNERIYDVESVIAYNENKDVAILRLSKATEEKTVKFGNPDDLKKGENITAIGSPLGIKNTVSTGDFSGRIPADGYNVLQFTASISPGSSGGALFNENGEVVGVTFASYTNGQNLNLAIPINIVSEVYNNRLEPIHTDVINRRKYPYVDYLKSATETSIFDINKNATKSIETGVIKNVYISSFDGVSLEKSEKAYIVADKSLVSGNFNYDKNNPNPNMIEIEWGINGEGLSYCSDGLELGSCVSVVINHRNYEVSDIDYRWNSNKCYVILKQS